MALIAEAGSNGDVAQRRGGHGELVARELDPHLADVPRKGRVVYAPERSREMDRVHAHTPGDGCKGQMLQKALFDERACLLQPDRRWTLRGPRNAPRRFS